MDFDSLHQQILVGADTQVETQLRGILAFGDLADVAIAEAHEVMALLQLFRGAFSLAAHHALLAIRHAQVAGAKAVEAHAHLRAGTALTFMADSPVAIDHLDAVLTISRDTPLPTLTLGLAHYNRALNFVRQHRYAAALEDYRCAASYYRDCDELRKWAHATRGAAWCLLHLDRAPEVPPYLDELADYVNRTSDDSIRFKLWVDRALYLRQTGDLESSSSLCHMALAERLAGPEVWTEAAWIAGQNAMDMKHWPFAEQMAAKALQHAIEAEWPHAMNQANRLRQRIRESRQAHDADPGA